MKNSFFLTVMILAVLSCNKEEVNSEVQTKEIKLIYNQVEYTTTLDENGKLRLSELNKNIQNAIVNGHSLELDDANSIYIFDTEAQEAKFIKQSLNISDLGAKNNKQAGAIGYFYEHSHYNGGFRTGNNTFYISNLDNAPYRFNDKISSTKIQNSTTSFYVVQFYQHKNLGGASHTKIVYPNSTGYIINFQNIGFNDTTSSIKGYFL